MSKRELWGGVPFAPGGECGDHHASKKHLFRYVDEFTFRLNEGNVERHTLERLDSFVDGVSGKRLTYARLI